MGLTKTNAQISIQDGAGAAVNLADAATGFYTPGAAVTFALQSTTGVQKWDLTFVCPSFPALHLRTLSWSQGMANSWQVQMPSTPSGQSNPYSGIEIVSVVSDGQASIGTAVSFLQTYGGVAPSVVRYARCATAAALSAYTASGGVLTANANGTQTVDGVTVAVGDKVLLTIGATAADNGLYIVTQKGLAGAKFVWTRAPEWMTGQTIQSGSTVEVSEGTVYANTTWKVTATANPVVDTTDPALYPARVTQSITLASGTKTITNVPILSATTTNCVLVRTATGGTVTSTIQYCPTVAGATGFTAGLVGTGQVVVQATVAAGTIAASDTSILSATIINF